MNLVGLDRAIQYAAASRLYRWHLWILGRPVKCRAMTAECAYQRASPQAATTRGPGSITPDDCTGLLSIVTSEKPTARS